MTPPVNKQKSSGQLYHICKTGSRFLIQFSDRNGVNYSKIWVPFPAFPGTQGIMENGSATTGNTAPSGEKAPGVDAPLTLFGDLFAFETFPGPDIPEF